MPVPSCADRNQVKELCALHALNNLFQSKVYTKNDLDGICESLAPSRWLNPHRSMLGLGNYDINVILAALQTKGYEGIWFDKRKDPEALNLSKIIGLIINAPNNYAFGVLKLPFNRRHWFAICKVGDKFYNMDSKLNAPVVIGSEPNLIEYLRSELKSNDRALFVVVHSDVEKSGLWLNSDSSNSEQS